MQVFFDSVMQHTDVGAAVGDAVVSFDNVAILAPRGRFEVEMYGSFMKLMGQVGGGRGLPALVTDKVFRISALADPVFSGSWWPSAWNFEGRQSSCGAEGRLTAPWMFLAHQRLILVRAAPPFLQAQDYRVQYDAMVRLFVLPKSNSPHTLVVISLDPPIRKGQTYYPHILIQFPTDDELSVELDISPEMLAAKNERVRIRGTNLIAGPD